MLPNNGGNVHCPIWGGHRLCTRYSKNLGVVDMMRLKDTTTTKSRTRKLGAVVAAVASVAGMVFAAAPATATVAAYPTSTFPIEFGASYYKGTVTWYNRSVGVTGAFKATGCRRVYAEAYAGSTWLDWQSSSTWCDRAGTAPLPLSADVAGGASKVNVWMTTGDPAEGLEYFVCYRGYSSCSGPYVGLPPLG
jgi:hypothetical protein